MGLPSLRCDQFRPQWHMNYTRIALGAVAFFISSFVIQGMVAFVIAGEYFASIETMRDAPLIYLGMPATLVTGIAFAILYPMTNVQGAPLMGGLKFGLLTAVLVVPFVALDIPSRFTVPSVGTWVVIQGVLGTLHFAIAGILVGLVYRKDRLA